MVQSKLNGAAVSVESSVLPWKNSTLLTVPSVSVALALIVTLAGAFTTVLFAGLVILTAGATFAAGSSVAKSFPPA